MCCNTFAFYVADHKLKTVSKSGCNFFWEESAKKLNRNKFTKLHIQKHALINSHEHKSNNFKVEINND